MRRPLSFLALALIVQSLSAKPRDSRSTYQEIEKGVALSAQDAAKLEERLAKKAGDEEARLQLLAYYAQPPAGMDLEAVKAARAKHIFFLIENDPKEGMGLFNIATGIHRINCQGDPLADSAAFERSKELWLIAVQKNPESVEVRRGAVDAIQFCEPERAEKMLLESGDEVALGRLYAAAVLGITGDSYKNNDPVGTDSAFRERPFARKARQALERATSKELLTAAAVSLLGRGAMLWADGKLDWDYTPLGNKLLEKAKAADPDALRLYTAPTLLPARGEHPPATLRIGGNVQASKLVQKIAPAYPPAARGQGIQGTVQMNALIGLDGKILRLQVVAGPPELIPASLQAVRQWEYKPTLLNGKPCYVITRIDVNYTLSQ